MVQTKLTALTLALAALVSCAPKVSWDYMPVDGHLTGVLAAGAENVAEKMGVCDGSVYTAPNGRVFDSGVTPSVAEILLDVQPQMADLKEIVGYCPEDMIKHRPESELSNWVADVFASEASRLAGMPVDLAIYNNGGIRVDLPQGDIFKDDIVSMFPFKNYLVVIKTRGKNLREAFDHMAADRCDAVSSSVRLVIDRKERKLVSAEIGGSPLDDEKIYTLATIDFLMDGGDGYNLAKNCTQMKITGYQSIDVFLPYVLSLKQEGKPLEHFLDGRITYVNEEERQ